jgi:hypothetical protein
MAGGIVGGSKSGSNDILTGLVSFVKGLFS